MGAASQSSFNVFDGISCFTIVLRFFVCLLKFFGQSGNIVGIAFSASLGISKSYYNKKCFTYNCITWLFIKLLIDRQDVTKIQVIACILYIEVLQNVILHFDIPTLTI